MGNSTWSEEAARPVSDKPSIAILPFAMPATSKNYSLRNGEQGHVGQMVEIWAAV
jgi:hypothetical protein